MGGGGRGGNNLRHGAGVRINHSTAILVNLICTRGLNSLTTKKQTTKSSSANFKKKC